MRELHVANRNSSAVSWRAVTGILTVGSRSSYGQSVWPRRVTGPCGCDMQYTFFLPVFLQILRRVEPTDRSWIQITTHWNKRRACSRFQTRLLLSAPAPCQRLVCSLAVTGAAVTVPARAAPSPERAAHADRVSSADS